MQVDGDAVAPTLGEEVRVRLRDAAPGSVEFHVVGASPISAPLFGGLLVPHPAIVLPLATNGASETGLPLRYPAAG